MHFFRRQGTSFTQSRDHVTRSCVIATSQIYKWRLIQIGTVQTRHFLHAVVPPGGKTNQAGSTGHPSFSTTPTTTDGYPREEGEALDDEMIYILDRMDLDDRTKVRLYNQVSLRYNVMSDKHVKEPLRVVVWSSRSF